jgi:hypothetical protein
MEQLPLNFGDNPRRCHLLIQDGSGTSYAFLAKGNIPVMIRQLLETC